MGANSTSMTSALWSTSVLVGGMRMETDLPSSLGDASNAMRLSKSATCWDFKSRPKQSLMYLMSTSLCLLSSRGYTAGKFYCQWVIWLSALPTLNDLLSAILQVLSGLLLTSELLSITSWCHACSNPSGQKFSQLNSPLSSLLDLQDMKAK